MKKIRNFHLPLPENLYHRLRKEADRSNQPATVLARQAIELWLHWKRRAALHSAIAEYAGRFAGTETGLDPDLEAAALEYWRAGIGGSS